LEPGPPGEFVPDFLAPGGGTSLATLTNDILATLLDMRTEWKATEDENVFEGRHPATGELRWTSTRVDLIFGSNSQLRAVAEIYACEDSQEKFLNDFVPVWNKV